MLLPYGSASATLFTVARARNDATTSALELLIPAARGKSLAKSTSAPVFESGKLAAIRLATVAGYAAHPRCGNLLFASKENSARSPEIASTKRKVLSGRDLASTQKPRSTQQSRLRPPA